MDSLTNFQKSLGNIVLTWPNAFWFWLVLGCVAVFILHGLGLLPENADGGSIDSGGDSGNGD